MTERDAIVFLVSSSPGYEVCLFVDMLSIFRLEDGTYCVDWDTNSQHELTQSTTPRVFGSQEFHMVEEAVDFYLEKRLELGIGYDLESLNGTPN